MSSAPLPPSHGQTLPDSSVAPEKSTSIGGRIRSSRELVKLLDDVIDLITPWPGQGHIRCRIEYKPFLYTLQYLAKEHTRGTVLDVGTGGGVLALCAAALGFETWALDHPSKRWMRDWLEPRGIRFIEHDLAHTPLPFESGSFDVVLLQDVLEHLPFSFRDGMTEMNRVLRPGGDLIVCTPNLTRLAARMKLLLGRSVHPPLRYFWESPFPFGGHFREYTLSEIQQILDWAGFVPRELRYVSRSSALRMSRLRSRKPVEAPERLALWKIAAQFGFDAAHVLWPSLGQTVWGVGRKATHS